MKKTLALALVAAMTISAASMTAFAKDVKYNTQSDKKAPEEVVATVTVTPDDVKVREVPTKYKAKEKVDGAVAVEKDAEIDAATYAKMGNKQDKFEVSETGKEYYTTFGDLGLTKYESTATKTFFGWAKGDKATEGETWVGINGTDATADPTKKDSVLKDSEEIIWETPDKGKTFTAQKFVTVGRTDTDDETIAKNLKAIEDKKNGGDAAQKEKDRLAELDKKYNADGKNAYDKEKKDVEGEVTFTEKKKAADSMDDFYYHAAKVAGVSTDADKTWVYDITMKDGQKLYEGKNQRVTLELNGVNKDADLSKFGVKVYHVEGWCKATRIKNVDVKGNKVTFWTNSFSPYVITIGDGVASTGAADASNPSTGDFSAVPVALLAAAALGATGFVAYKKRKAE